MSKFAFEANEKEATVEFDYRGLVFIMLKHPDIRAWRKVLFEQIAEAGEDSDLMSKSPEEGGADVDTVTRWLGRAMASTFIKDVKDRNEDGELIPLVIEGEEFDFNAESDLDYFDTQGEELIGSNPVMQNKLYIEAERLEKNPANYEIKALGKS